MIQSPLPQDVQCQWSVGPSIDPENLDQRQGLSTRVRRVMGRISVLCGVCVAALGMWVSYCAVQEPPCPTFKIHSHNVLAAQYTKYNKAFHRSNGDIESHAQTKQRYSLAGSAILQSGADAVCLQV